MATKNLPAKMYKSGQRTEKNLRFNMSGSGTVYIDLAKALSEVNRVAYRQGLYYYVQSVEFQDNADGSTLDIETLSDTWVTKNAWIRAYLHWDKQQDELDIPRAKYNDFKVRMSSETASGTFQIPAQGGNRSANNDGSGSGEGGADEWNRSEFMFHKTGESGGMGGLVLYMCGDHSGTGDSQSGYGIIKGYADTRRNAGIITSSNDPVPTAITEDKMANYGSDGHPELIDKIVEENDLTPYDHDIYHGTRSTDLTNQFRLTTGAGAGRAVVSGGFCAPFGLLKVTSSVDAAFSFNIKLVPGPYHGVYAERVFDEQ